MLFTVTLIEYYIYLYLLISNNSNYPIYEERTYCSISWNFIQVKVWTILCINRSYKGVHVEQYFDPSARQEYISTICFSLTLFNIYNENSCWITVWCTFVNFLLIEFALKNENQNWRTNANFRFFTCLKAIYCFKF